MSKRKWTKYWFFALLNILHICVSHFMGAVFFFLLNPKDCVPKVNVLIQTLLFGPFILLYVSWVALIPAIIMMLVMVWKFNMHMLSAYWSSLALYVIIMFFVYGEDTIVLCGVPALITGVVMSLIFWKTFERLGTEGKSKKALDS